MIVRPCPEWFWEGWLFLGMTKKWALYGLTWVVAGVFVYLALRRQDLGELWDTLKQADYTWVAIITVVSFGVHWIRAWRWAMLLEPLGFRPAVGWCFLAIMSGYLANLAVPRLGELTRCATLQKGYRLEFAALLGTVVTERAIDMSCLMLVFLLALAIQYQKLMGLTTMLGEAALLKIQTYWLSVLLAMVLASVLLWGLRRQGWGRWLWDKLLKTKQGIVTVGKLRQPTLFWILTTLIWLCYFLTTYLWFFSYSQTADLSPLTGLVFMTFGSLGRTLPIQGGGIGAYHYIFAQVAMLYGVPQTIANAMAILNHGLQTVYYLVVGAFCVGWVAWKSRK